MGRGIRHPRKAWIFTIKSNGTRCLWRSVSRDHYTLFVNRQALVIGLGTAAVAVGGWVRRRWILQQTPKGRTLVEAFGANGAQWILNALLAVVFIFGIGLAAGWIVPLRW